MRRIASLVQGGMLLSTKTNPAKTSHPRPWRPGSQEKSPGEGLLSIPNQIFPAFMKDFNFKLTIGPHIRSCGIEAMNFESASPAVVKSIKQRELLNVLAPALCPAGMCAAARGLPARPPRR